jgi:ferredoxin
MERNVLHFAIGCPDDLQRSALQTAAGDRPVARADAVEQHMSPPSIAVYVFSGTGNTRYVADLLARELERLGLRVTTRFIHRDLIAARELDPDPRRADLVGLAYPIYGWDAPRPVFELIERFPALSGAGGKPAFLLRTAGDPLLNGGATVTVRDRLLARGYGVFRDDLVVMPSNMVLRYEERLVKQLLLKAERVAKRAAEGIANTEVSLPRETVVARLTTWLFGGAPRRGARWFGRHTRVSAACIGCGRCARECPTGNIRLEGERPRFARECALCLHCFYACPEKALTPILGRWLLIDGWYDLPALARDDAVPADFLSDETRGYYRRLWRYIQSP